MRDRRRHGGEKCEVTGCDEAGVNRVVKMKRNVLKDGTLHVKQYEVTVRRCDEHTSRWDVLA